MKEIKILHLFPKLLSLYGEYGNVVVLKSTLEAMGCQVTLDTWERGELEIGGYDFVYAGCGTEENLRFALKRLAPHAEGFRAAVDKGMTVLATGNAMAIFGKHMDGEDALGIGSFDTRITDKRFLGDVLTGDAFGAPLLGFVNTSCIYTGAGEGLWQFRLNPKLGFDKTGAADGLRAGGRSGRHGHPG